MKMLRKVWVMEIGTLDKKVEAPMSLTWFGNSVKNSTSDFYLLYQVTKLPSLYHICSSGNCFCGVLHVLQQEVPLGSLGSPPTSQKHADTQLTTLYFH